MGVLLLLLEKGEAVRGARQRILGYGLNQSDFDNDDYHCTREIFRKRSKELEDKRLIKRIKTKYKLKKYYSITPLGIIFLVNHKGIKFDDTKKIADIVCFHYKVFFERLYKNKDLSKIDFEIMKNIIYKMPKELKKTIKQNLMNVLNGIKILDEGNKITVFLTYSIPQSGPVVDQIFTIAEDVIYHDYQGFTAVRQERDNDWFYGALSHFISLAFNHSLVLQNFLFIGGKAIISPKRKKKVQSLYKIISKNEFFGFTNGMIDNFETKSNALKSVTNLVKELK